MNKSIILALLGLVSISGCSTYSLEELRQTTTQGNAFQKHLAKFYMDYATQEEKSYDWRDSWHFADKGLMAAYGKETMPENIEDWEIPEDVLPKFKKASEDLQRLLTAENIAKKPETAARAQFYYDCWIEQQEEGWQQDEIEFCRYEYLKAISKLEDTQSVPAKKHLKKKAKQAIKAPEKIAEKLETEKPSEAKPVAESADKGLAVVLSSDKAEKEPAENVPAPTKEVVTTTSFVVFFDSGETVLTSTADSVLGDVVKNVAGQDNYDIVVTNKSKAGDDNLFKERFTAIKNKLLENKLADTAIHTGTAASSQSSINKKIEIFVND